jgi:hypothetical protein
LDSLLAAVVAAGLAGCATALKATVEDTTFPDAGQVGLWTKADSVTLFDDFCYGPK